MDMTQGQAPDRRLVYVNRALLRCAVQQGEMLTLYFEGAAPLVLANARLPEETTATTSAETKNATNVAVSS